MLLQSRWQNLGSTIKRHNMPLFAEQVCPASVVTGALSYFKTDSIGS